MLDNARSAIEIARGISNIIDFIANTYNFKSSIPKYNNKLNFTFKEASQSFYIHAKQAMCLGAGNWTNGYLLDRARGHKLTSYIIFMPSFMPGIRKDIKASLNGIPLKLVFYVPSKVKFPQDLDQVGLIGIGVEMAKKRQLIRTDIGAKHPGHKQRVGEIDILEGTKFHTHIYRWDGKQW